MRTFLSMLVLCAVCADAGAQPPVQKAPKLAAPASIEAARPRLALGLNSPLGWLIGAFGASAYVRIGDHVAVRGNLATWTNRGTGGGGGAILSGFDQGAMHGGSIEDVGVGAVLYPERTWDGPMVEVGALRRGRNVYVSPEFGAKVTTRSTTYAGRALVGWSWLVRESVFISFAVGGSWGSESGEDISTEEDRGMTTTTPVRRKRTDGESYVRIGFVFGS